MSLSILASGIAGCSHTTVTQTVADALFPPGKERVDHIRLNPNLRYLRVTTQSQTVLLVLGYTEDHKEGKTEVWYSDSGQVLRLRGGRLLGSAGLATDWLNVRYSFMPSWQAIAEHATLSYQRQRDQMPGYRFGISESVSIHPIDPPTDTHLVWRSKQPLRWFEERSLSQVAPSLLARYALVETKGNLRLVYGDQCLTTTFCLSWQVWPAE